MKNLRRLRLEFYNIDADSAKVLAHLPALETLEVVEIDCKAADLAALKECRRLNSFAVECHDLHGETLHYVTDLARLEHLHLLDAALTDEDLGILGRMKSLSSITLEGGNGTRFSNIRGTATIPKGEGEPEITVEFRP